MTNDNTAAEVHQERNNPHRVVSAVITAASFPAKLFKQVKAICIYYCLKTNSTHA